MKLVWIHVVEATEIPKKPWRPLIKNFIPYNSASNADLTFWDVKWMDPIWTKVFKFSNWQNSQWGWVYDGIFQKILSPPKLLPRAFYSGEKNIQTHFNIEVSWSITVFLFLDDGIFGERFTYSANQNIVELAPHDGISWNTFIGSFFQWRYFLFEWR